MSMPKWIAEWIQKDRLVWNKYKLSRKYLRRSKSVKFIEGEKYQGKDKWAWFKYSVNSKKYGRYWVKYNQGRYDCNCSFFKHRGICSHILAVAQETDVWPQKETIFGK